MGKLRLVVVEKPGMFNGKPFVRRSFAVVEEGKEPEREATPKKEKRRRRARKDSVSVDRFLTARTIRGRVED